MYKCWHCNGKKQVLSTGCMFKECTTCKGVGYTKEKKEIVIPVNSLPIDDELVINTDVIDTTTSIQAIEYKRKLGKPRKRNITDSNVMASDILKTV